MAEDEKKTEDTVDKPKKQSAKKGPLQWIKKRWKILLIIVVVAGFIALGYGYIHTKNELNKLSDNKAAAQTEIQQITKQISKTVELPSGETPILSSVIDAAKVKGQGAFFKNAQNGDKVLIYQSAGVAVLYRPSTKKVIVFAPINLGSNATNQ